MTDRHRPSNSGRESSLSELIVTGEKIERSLADTVSSVTVLTAEDIAAKPGVASVSETLNNVPNLVYTGSVGAPVIRGQDTQGPNFGATAFFAGTVPRATINVDGQYLNYNQSYFGSTSIWDVAGVEVYRGPQTTSQGANAIAGAIIVKTKDPTFHPEMAYQLEAGNYNSRRASVMLSGPLIKDELAARLALDYSSRDTVIDYVSPSFQQGSSDQDFQSFTGRAKLLWLPATIPGLEMKLTYSYNSSNRPTQESASEPFDKLEHVAISMPSWKQHTHTGVLDINYDFDNGLMLFNQTQYSAAQVERITDTTFNGNADVDQTNISHEARLTFGNQHDALRGVAGLYYAHVETDEKLYLSGISAFDDTKQNLGIFSELSYKFRDRWTLTGGLRYQHDQVQRRGTSVYAPQPVDFDTNFTAVLPKVSLAYALTQNWTLGALVNRGYNPGGVSLNLSARQWTPFKEETLWNYELFTRVELLDNRLFLSSNIFYMDLKNAQYHIPVVVSPGVSQSYTINAEKAHAYGLEVGVDYLLFDNLTVKTSAGLLQTRVDKFDANVGYKGNEFAGSPGYMLSLGVGWDVTSKLNLYTQVRHLDKYYSDIANTADFVVDAYTLADARVSYRINEQLEIYGYVRNIFDECSAMHKQQNRAIGGLEASVTTPRMFGLGIKGSY